MKQEKLHSFDVCFFSDQDHMELKEIPCVPLKTEMVTCHYPKSHEASEKFLCKGENLSNCEKLLHAKEERDIKKFHLRDNRRLNQFNVHIKPVNQTDCGVYWCVSGGSNDTKVTKILLSVGEYTDAQQGCKSYSVL